ncbi:D-isomer specific 2-hydroxyacid dehydrogenase [Xylariales sp. AK1849]|nr:D-isomer specific 2-hydroxyacid dehydrogenase [Xylariales sp. AK1849]
MSAPNSSRLGKDKMLVFIPEDPHHEWISKIKSTYPGFEIRWVNSIKPDGSLTAYEELDDEVWDGLTILVAYVPPPAKLLSKVRFVQLTSAGADKWTQHDTYKDDKVIFCTTNGIHPPQIAEWVIGAWLSHQHHFSRYEQQMKRGFWEPLYTSRVEDSTGARMGILGYGAIGRQCARVANAMGMEIYAYTRTEKDTPESRKDDSYCVPGTGDPDGLIPAKWFHGAYRDDIDKFLHQDLDILVVSLPLTESTHGLISYEQFEILSKKKTFLCNIARGGHINQEALIQALELGLIRGAALDVTDPEPLNSDHPLWKTPNVLITPHVSWLSNHYWDRIMDILEINLGKLSTGERLINVVNRQYHY